MKSILWLALTATMVFASTANAALSTTWEFTGVVDDVLRNDVGFPVPLGAPISIQLTFDPLTPNTNTFPGAADYLMSGGGTTLQVKIGSHLSTPVSSFRFTIFTEGCCAAEDQIKVHSFTSQGDFVDVSFPGYLENAEAYLFFRRRFTPNPIISNELPTVQPNPKAFYDARLVIFKNRSSINNRLSFSATLDGTPVPESSTAILGLLAAISVAAIGFRSRQIRSARNQPDV